MDKDALNQSREQIQTLAAEARASSSLSLDHRGLLESARLESFLHLADELNRPYHELPGPLRKLLIFNFPPVSRLVLKIYELLTRRQRIINAQLIEAVREMGKRTR